MKNIIINIVLIGIIIGCVAFLRMFNTPTFQAGDRVQFFGTYGTCKGMITDNPIQPTFFHSPSYQVRARCSGVVFEVETDIIQTHLKAWDGE